MTGIGSGRDHSKVTFGIQVVSPPEARTERRRVGTEDEAVAAAASIVGPNVTQVTIDTSYMGPGTFGIRHITWRDGLVRDSGWIGWQDGVFVGARHPSELRPEGDAG